MCGLELATCHLRVHRSHMESHDISYLRGQPNLNKYRRPNLNDIDNTDISNSELKMK